MNEERCRLYLITPPAFEIEPFAGSLSRALDAGDVACVQLRLKGPDTLDDSIKRAAERLLPICQKRDVAFVINDRPDLALSVGADGAHVGSDDMGYHEARALLQDDRIVGVSCYDSRHLAIEAGEAGADYVAFGAFFPSYSKTPKTRAETSLLEWWHGTTTVPSVAIGGITAENCEPLVKAGADFLAVIGGVWHHPEGPAAGVKSINAAIDIAHQG